MKRLAILTSVTLGVAASAQAQPPTSQPPLIFSAPVAYSTPAPAPVHQNVAPPPPVHQNFAPPPPTRTYAQPTQTRTYNSTPVHNFQSSSGSSQRRTQSTSSSSNGGTTSRSRHTSTDSASNPTSTRTHSSSSSTHTTASSTRTHPVSSTTASTRSSTVSSTTHTSGAIVSKGPGTQLRKAPIATIGTIHTGTVHGVPTHTLTTTGGRTITTSGPKKQGVVYGGGGGTISRTKDGVSVNVAPYGPAPLVLPVVVTPGFGYACADTRVVDFYDGSVAEAEWSPNVETQWDTALETEFADMEVANASAPPPDAPPVPRSGGRPVLAPSEDDLAKADQLEYDTLLKMALKLNTIKDEDEAVAAENKFVKRSGKYLANHPDEVALWVLRARLAVHINQEDLGREAGENLKRLVDAGTDDTKWHGLMVELSARDWLSAA